MPLFEAEGHHFTTIYRTFDGTPDGRFLMIREDASRDTPLAAQQDRIILVQHWFQELTERVPVP